MKRHILRQMSTEWRSNAGLLAELVVTGLVLWACAGSSRASCSSVPQKAAATFEGVFTASIVYMGGDSVAIEQHRSDLDALVNHFKSKPEVLHVGYGNKSDPYNMSYWGNTVRHINGEDTIGFDVNLRHMSPELMEVYQIHGLDGATPAEMRRRLERGDIILGYDRVRDDVRQRVDSLLGSEMSTYSYRGTFSTLVKPIKRMDYEPVDMMAVLPLQRTTRPQSFAVRVRPEAARSFVDGLNASDFRMGTVLLSGITSMENQRTRIQAP